jgi:glutamate-ammonia-ligase adenylyltransferase
LAEITADRGRFLELAEAVRTPRDLALDVLARGEGDWTIAIGTADQPGAQSIIAGWLTAYRLSVASADLLTLADTVSPQRSRSAVLKHRSASLASLPPTRRLLDVFDVRVLAGAPPDWPQRLRRDLSATVFANDVEAAKDELIDHASEAIQAHGANQSTLLPVTIDVSQESASAATILRVRSADAPGFLFAFTNALANFGINVERATIRTVDGEASDTFWVTDVGRRPIVDEKRIHDLRIATTLIKQFTYLLPRSPNPGQALRQFTALVRQLLAHPEWTSDLTRLESLPALETLANLLGVSRFLWEEFLRMQHESLFPLVLAPATRVAMNDGLRVTLAGQKADGASHGDRVNTLNLIKDREMFRIDLRYIVGQSSFATFSRELTGLADVALDAACHLAIEELASKYGRARLSDARPCSWCVGGLGKFGGGELGYGSDLEMIFVYEDDGQTDGARSIVNGEYFIYVVQALPRTLRARPDGIFEIDLRLRPFGRAGGLASSLGGFASYYSERGSAEQFERLALVRLRPVAGDSALGSAVQRRRDAFVYSGRPLDLANIRHLRRRQATELVPRGQVNAKYSAGGIVDLEYFVQAWQIVAGAADPTVRVTNTIEAIDRLADGGYVGASLADDLKSTHVFLRQLIEGLRVVRGHAKDLTIPPADSRDFAYLARRLKFASTATLKSEVDSRIDLSSSLWSETSPLPR